MPNPTWSQVTAAPLYKQLTLAQREAARADFFKQYIAPQAPQEHLPEIASAWDEQTSPTYGAKGSGTPADPFEFGGTKYADRFLAENSGTHWVKTSDGGITNKPMLERSLWERGKDFAANVVGSTGSMAGSVTDATQADPNFVGSYFETEHPILGKVAKPIVSMISGGERVAENAIGVVHSLSKWLGASSIEEATANGLDAIAEKTAEANKRRKELGMPTLESERESQVMTGAADVFRDFAGYAQSLTSPQDKEFSSRISSASNEGIKSTAAFVWDNPLDAMQSVSAQSLPYLIPGAITGRITSAAGTAAGLSPAAAKTLVVAASLSADANTAALSGADQVAQQIKEAPEDALLQVPEYQEALSRNDGDAKLARAELTKRGWQAAYGADLLFNAVTMGLGQKYGLNIVENKLAGVNGVVTYGGPVRAAIAGVTKESIGEFSQESGDQLAQNLGEVEAGQRRSEDTLKGVGGAGVLGAFSAGPLGGLAGYAEHYAEKPLTPMPTIDEVGKPGAGQQAATSVLEHAQEINRVSSPLNTVTGNNQPATVDPNAPLSAAPAVEDQATPQEVAAMQDTSNALVERLQSLDEQASKQLPQGQRKELERERGEILAAIAEHDDKVKSGILIAPQDRIDPQLRSTLAARVSEVNNQVAQHKAAVSAATQASDLRARIDKAGSPLALIKLEQAQGGRESSAVPEAPVAAPVAAPQQQAAPAPAQAAVEPVAAEPNVKQGEAQLPQLPAAASESDLDAAMNRLTESGRAIVDAPQVETPVGERAQRRTAPTPFQPMAQAKRKITEFGRLLRKALIGELDIARKLPRNQLSVADKQFLDSINPDDLSQFQEVELTGKDRWRVKQLEGILGKRIVFTSAFDANGKIIPAMQMVNGNMTTGFFNGYIFRSDPRVMFINADLSDKSPIAVIGHEFLHLLRETDQSLYHEFRDIAVARIKKTSAAAKSRYAQYKASLNNNQDLMDEELFADFWGDMFNDEAFWKELARREPSMFERVLKTMIDLLNSLVNKKNHSSGAMFDDIAHLRDVATDIFIRYSKQNVVPGDVKASVDLQRKNGDERSRQQIEDMFKPLKPREDDNQNQDDSEMVELPMWDRANSRGRPDRAASRSDSGNVSDVKAESSIDQHKIAQLLGAQLYNEMPAMANVTVKELAQNAFDAIKGAVERGTLKDGEGKISITVSGHERTVTITDNADGMDADIINKHFLQIGGSKKNTSRPSGGFGIAKMLFLYGSEKLSLTSVRDGIETTFETTGKQVMNSLNGGDAGVIRRQATNKPSGTSITVTIPSKYVNADGEEQNIYPPSIYDAQGTIEKSPLFENIEVTINGKVLPVGKNFDSSGLKLISRAKFPWGTASIMIRPKTANDSSRNNFIVLSNGIYQFEQTLKKNPLDWGSDPLPFIVYMNAEPSVEAADPRYPFSMNRQGVKDSLKADFSSVQNYIAALYGNRDNSEKIKSFGSLQTMDASGNVKSISLAIPEGDTSGMLDLTPDTEVSVQDGKLVVGGREVPQLDAAAMRKIRVNPMQHSIDQEQLNHDHVILHDNMVSLGLDDTSAKGEGMIKAARKALGAKKVDAYLFAISNVFAGLRNAASAEFPYKYGEHSVYNDVKTVPVGISLDVGYYGVSTNIPFRAMMLNPSLNRYMTSNSIAQEQVGRAFVGTMIHEIVHHVERNHSETGYIPALSELNIALAMSGDTKNAVNKVQYIIDRYQDVYKWFIEENKNGRFESAGIRLEDGQSEVASGRASEGDVAGVRSASKSGRNTYLGRESANAGSQSGSESNQREGASVDGQSGNGESVGRPDRAASRASVPRPPTQAAPPQRPQSPLGVPVRTGYLGKAKTFVKRQADSFVRTFLDSFTDLKRMQDYVESQIGQKLPMWAQPWRAENLRHGSFVDKRKLAIKEYLEPVAELLESHDYDRHEFEDYLWARHAGERDAFLRSKLDPTKPAPTYLAGMTPQEAQNYINNLDPAKRKVFDQAAGHIDKLRKHILDVLTQSGQISADHRDELLAQYQHYVPLRGLPEGSDPDLSNSGVGAGGGLSMKASPLGKRATGRVSAPNDILEEMTHDLDRALIGAEKQVVLKQLIGLITLNPDKALWSVSPIVPKRKWVNGVLTVVDTEGDPNSQLLYMHNGTPIKIEIADPLLRAALVDMNKDASINQVPVIGSVFRFMSKITRAFSAVKTSLNPYFILPNAVRDLQFAAIGMTAEMGRKVIKDAMKIYTFQNPWGALREDNRGMTMAQLRNARPLIRYAREFAAQGGKTGYTMASDITQQRKDLNALFTLHSKNKLSGRTAKKALLKAGEYIESVNEYIENATRLSAYAALRQNGVDPKTAAEYAKNITVNFNRKGKGAREMSALYLFFNPAVQGTVRLYNLWKNPKARVIFGGMIAASYALALYSMHEMGDDDDGENKYEKLVGENAAARSLTIPLGEQTKLQMPMAYGPNIFTHLGYVAAQATYRRQTGKPIRPGELAHSVLLNLLNSMSPIPAERGMDAWQPEVLRVASNLRNNEGDFPNSKINYQMTDNDKDKQDANWASTGPSTGEIYKKIARGLSVLTGGDLKGYEGGFFNVSGEHVKYAAAQALGGPAKFASESYEFIENLLAGDKEEMKPGNVPVLNSFVRNVTPAEQARPAYYRDKEEFDHLKNVYKKASGMFDKSTGQWTTEPDTDKLESLLAEHPWLINADADASTKAGKAAQAGSVMESQRDTEKAIKELRDERERVSADDSLGILERHQRMRQIDEEIGQWQKNFTRQVNAAKASSEN